MAVGITGLCLVWAGPAAATFPGANGRIAYSDLSIHTILPSGHGDSEIGGGFNPSWSPDGQRIAFSSGGGTDFQIYSMPADGGAWRLVARNGNNPSYSPNGRRIAYTSLMAADGAVATVRPNGSDRQILARGGGFPVWSPAGKWIAYLVGRTATAAPSIWAMRPNGTDKHRLAFLGSNGGYFSDFSPNGKRFIFVRSTEHEPDQTFVGTSDGSNFHPLPCAPPFAGGTYSPDGKWLLGAVSNRHGDGTHNLVKLNLHECQTGRVRYKTIKAEVSLIGLPSWLALPIP
jgi:TolB protein